MNYTIDDPHLLLGGLLPDAEKRADTMEKGKMTEVTGVAKAAMPHFKLDNIEGVYIRQQPGGWACDLMLKEVPPGVCNLMGSPTNTPIASLDQAIDYAITMLAILIVRADLGDDELAPTDPVFEYHNVEITLPQESVTKAAEMAKTLQVGDNTDYVEMRLGHMDQKYCVNGVVRDGLTEDEKHDINVIALMALVAGIIRWPRPTPPTITN